MRSKNLVLSVAIVLGGAAISRAGIVITEVNPTGSSSTYAADWFELTNTDTDSINIAGWKVDDSSRAFATALDLRGITSIAPGQSVIFAETASTTTDTDVKTAFKAAWFGVNVPAGFAMGNYGGSGIGLSSGGDEVNIFDSAGNRITGVSFAAATLGTTFDNFAGVGGITDPPPAISTLSVTGTHGAFVATNSEIGSPGVVPEPAALGVVAIAALGMFRRRRAVR
jgi:hypothetical protein